MFGNLKKKLKGFLSKSKEQLEPELPKETEEIVEKVVEVPEPKPEPESEVESEPEPEVQPIEIIEPEVPSAEVEVSEVEPEVEPEVPELEESVVEKKPKKKLGLLARVRKKTLTEKNIDPLLWDLEIALLENDVAKEVSEAITSNVKEELSGAAATRGNIETLIQNALKASIENILNKEKPDLFKLIDAKKEKPFVIVFCGFNGTGKTLTIGKLAKILKDNGYSIVFAAGDTFRAAAIEQLEVHGNALGIPVIKQMRGADSAAVVYDAIAHGKANKVDVVLVDTAGRAGTNINLMDELKKIVRVSSPDLKIFVGDSLTGNDAAEQARAFNEAVGIDGSVLTKIDTDAKGGACLSVAFVTDKPILYLGTGQNYEDMIDFNSDWFVSKVF